jgi:hypothetical protein
MNSAAADRHAQSGATAYIKGIDVDLLGATFLHDG